MMRVEGCAPGAQKQLKTSSVALTVDNLHVRYLLVLLFGEKAQLMMVVHESVIPSSRLEVPVPRTRPWQTELR